MSFSSRNITCSAFELHPPWPSNVIVYFAGTTVRGNIWAVLHNEEHYPDPDTFKPERFLDAEGKYAKPDPKHSVNFGIGKSDAEYSYTCVNHVVKISK